MTDVAFSGLGSFVLFLFTSSLFGLVVLLLGIRHFMLKNESKETHRNRLVFQAALIPFFTGIIGLICLEIFDNQPLIKKLFDQYLAIAMVCFALALAILYLITGFRRLAKR